MLNLPQLNRLVDDFRAQIINDEQSHSRKKLIEYLSRLTKNDIHENEIDLINTLAALVTAHGGISTLIEGFSSQYPSFSRKIFRKSVHLTADSSWTDEKIAKKMIQKKRAIETQVSLTRPEDADFFFRAAKLECVIFNPLRPSWIESLIDWKPADLAEYQKNHQLYLEKVKKTEHTRQALDQISVQLKKNRETKAEIKKNRLHSDHRMSTFEGRTGQALIQTRDLSYVNMIWLILMFIEIVLIGKRLISSKKMKVLVHFYDSHPSFTHEEAHIKTVQADPRENIVIHGWSHADTSSHLQKKLMFSQKPILKKNSTDVHPQTQTKKYSFKKVHFE